MRTGAGADNKEERILNFTVQPHNAGQTTKHFTLATLTQNGRSFTTSSLYVGDDIQALTSFD